MKGMLDSADMLRSHETAAASDVYEGLAWISAGSIVQYRKYNRWRSYWNFGGGAMTDLFTHWIDVVHWAMHEADHPVKAQMFGDKYIFEQWDCPGYHPGRIPISLH